MKAIVNYKYGKPERVQNFTEIETPEPKANEVQIKIHASSINSWDYDLVTGIPRIYRLIFGLFKPNATIAGIDVAGEITALGENVTEFKIGDRVFGDISESNFGAFAEYTCAKANSLAKIPEGLKFTDAAAIPHAGVLALQSLQKLKSITAETKILINGAGGCVGPFVIQMAKQKGAQITAVDSSEKFDLLRKLGADKLIDYKTTDFTTEDEKYDIIVELLARRSVFKYNKCLNKQGILTVVGGLPRKLIQIGLIGGILSSKKGKNLGLLMHKPNPTDLNTLANLVNKGDIKLMIDKTVRLEDVPNAVQQIGDGKIHGKIIITMKH